MDIFFYIPIKCLKVPAYFLTTESAPSVMP